MGMTSLCTSILATLKWFPGFAFNASSKAPTEPFSKPYQIALKIRKTLRKNLVSLSLLFCMQLGRKQGNFSLGRNSFDIFHGRVAHEALLGSISGDPKKNSKDR